MRSLRGSSVHACALPALATPTSGCEGTGYTKGGAGTWFLYASSNSAAPPWPPPAHMVTTPYRAWRQRISLAIVPTRREPVMPKGWPIAIEPPFTLSRSIGMPSVSAVEHLRGERFVDLPEVDVLDAQLVRVRQLRHREDGADSNVVRLAAGHGVAAEDE